VSSRGWRLRDRAIRCRPGSDRPARCSPRAGARGEQTGDDDEQEHIDSPITNVAEPQLGRSRVEPFGLERHEVRLRRLERLGKS
jgi:hypothetical protein